MSVAEVATPAVVAGYKKSVTENLVYDSAKHLHGVGFFVQIDFFTTLLPSQFSYQITLAEDPDSSMPSYDRVGYIPFSVHSKSQMKEKDTLRVRYWNNTKTAVR